jgi:hypothetical protein
VGVSGLEPRRPAGPPSDPRDLRCSDADREVVAEALRQAAGDGRLTLDELDERLEATYTARTYRDLEPVVSDLPGARLPGPRAAAPSVPQTPDPATGLPGPSGLARVGGTATTDSAVAVFAEAKRTGPWTLPAEFASVAVFGSVELDLWEASLVSRETTIQANAIFGSVVVYVPADITVSTGGAGVFGEYSGPHEAATGQAPHVSITGLALFGSVEVKRKPPRRFKRLKGLTSG